MLKRKSYLLSLIAAVFFLSGCAVAVIGGAAAGAGSALYVNGVLKTDYYHSFDAVWAACEKTVADMHGLDVEPNKEIGAGRINTVIHNEKVQFNIQYKAKNVITVAIRVGLLGNQSSSQLLHDKINDNLKKK
jgi:type IV secretory pathway VirB6-like protein